MVVDVIKKRYRDYDDEDLTDKSAGWVGLEPVDPAD